MSGKYKVDQVEEDLNLAEDKWTWFMQDIWFIDNVKYNWESHLYPPREKERV